MKVLFDLTGIQPRSDNIKFHGGGYYGEVIFFALLKKTGDFMGIYNSKSYINPKILESGIKIYDINEISPQEVIEKEHIETFYTPLYSERQLKVKRYLMTWHGLRMLEMADCGISNYNYYNAFKIKGPFKNIFKWAVKKKYDKQAYVENAEYITVSEHSKASIISFYPHLAKSKIVVCYSPFMEENEAGDLPQGILPKTYFLLTSSARWEKNNLRAVWAFDELFSQRKDIDFKVVLTGVDKRRIFERNLKNRDKFIFLGYISRAELLSLHKNAYAFIYPSLNEGFGYPPMESMRYGIPVAASGTSSIPEVCQDAAIYFDPYNSSEIKNRIIQLLNRDIYEKYCTRTAERYKIVSEKQKLDLEKAANFILGVEE
ncbi:MAG: glycosyltransferase [Fibromonadales bacterium]|nr:glycosyltransferase [Fibromonadales bacterium]